MKNGNSPHELEDMDDDIGMMEGDDTPLHSPPATRPTNISTISGSQGRIYEPGAGQSGYNPNASVDNVQREDDEKPKKKKCCPEHCVNKNLLPLKILVFIFYGGIGVLSTWLNHNVLSKRFTERETALIYGLAALFSIPFPIIFGLVSDRLAQPKKVLAVCLLLAGLTAPLVMLVPSTEPYHFKERLDWCRSQLGRNHTTCLPNHVKCRETLSELVHTGKCGERCSGKLILTKCSYYCDEYHEPNTGASTGENSTTIPSVHTNGKGDDGLIDYDVDGNKVILEPQAQIYDRSHQMYHNPGGADFARFDIQPHVCFLKTEHPTAKGSPLCHVFDTDMHDVVLDVRDISGTIDPEDGKCHYPILGYSDSTEEFEQLLSCSPLSGPNCHVSCNLHWNFDGTDQWVCGDTYRQWLISFFVFLGVHTAGNMFIVTAAGLLNTAIMCSVHEHEHGEYVGCQFIYAAFGFATCSPVLAYLFQVFNWEPNQWNIAYIVAFSSWLLLCALLSLCLPYNAEWVPKSKDIRPMLQRWMVKSSTLLFFLLIVTLGCLQAIIDILGYYQIRSIVRSQFLELGDLTSIGLTATAAIVPGFVFLFRVEKVIEFCGYQNLLAISFVVFSLQFTGYAYLKDVVVEWSFLIKALDIFSIIMVLVTSSFTIHASAPRRLVATCQVILVTLYCCIGRGIGGLLTNLGLWLFQKDYLFKIVSLCCVAICLIFLIVHYTCLKPVPYSKKYKVDKLPESQGPSGKYIPLKLVSHKDKSEDQEKDTEEM